MRIEDEPLLRGERHFVDDLADHDALRAVFVRSTFAHGRIVDVDTAAAIDAPGVVGVFTAGDLALGRIRAHPFLRHDHDRPPLAEGTVRFVGDPVAVVVATTQAEAVDAAELVVVDVDAAPATLFGDGGAPVAFEVATAKEHDVLDAADVVVRGRFVNQRVATAPMEPDGALAVPTDDGRLTVWSSTQRVHAVRDAIAASVGVDPDDVRVRAANVGGGFGGKFEPSPETIVVAAVARRLQRAVAWTQTRTENLLCMPHGRAQRQDAALAVQRDGTFVGVWADLVGDAGAYPTVGALIPMATLQMLAGTYGVRRAGGRARAVVTNTTPVGAYRGAGRPEAAALVERLVDMAAAELAVDPIDLRRRNLVRAFPHRTPTGMTYDSGDYVACLDGAVEAVGYEAARKEQAARRATGDTRMVGVGAAMWIDCTPMNRPGEWASVRVVPDAHHVGVRVHIRDGANDQGQGHGTTWATLVGERLGIPPDAVVLHNGDTAHVPHGEGTGSARSLMLAGGAVARAADAVLDHARHVAADLLEASPDDVVLGRDGRFAVNGAPAITITWTDVVRHVGDTGTDLAADVDYGQAGPTFPAGCHAAVVEVDAETGGVRLVRFVAVDDCGRVVHPTLVEGQQHGGIAQGIAQALFEEIVHDAHGTPLTTTFADYAIPSAADLPAFDVRTADVVSPVNALGAKGIGQAGAIGSTIAVQNAVVDAGAHLGVRHIDLPLTPERVWRAFNTR